MERKRVVAALGHRALGTTLPEQKRATRRTAKMIADLVEAGANIAITHSNAPQVGMIHTAMNEFMKQHPSYTAAPMSICSAMSQGYIGYDLQNSIRAELLRRGIYKPVSTIVTQVQVDPYDEAFSDPEKIIGRLLTAEEADSEEQKGNFVTETDGGFRRIVAAPKPQEIVEKEAIRTLFDADQIVIACGGGGIPVLEQEEELAGASAVIEKDLISAKLAELLDADVLMILTGVEHVCVGYRTEQERKLSAVTAEEMRRYMEQGEFEAGSMLPKVEAALAFLDGGENRRAVITSIDRARDGYLGRTGTIITK